MHCRSSDVTPKSVRKNKKIDSSDCTCDLAPRIKRHLALRGLSRFEAAQYVGVSPSLFDKMVEDGRMPQPIRINSRVVWDVNDLDDAFDDLKDEPPRNPWDDV
jgi:predicted DNA-binding transcriptional regulator AlpA